MNGPVSRQIKATEQMATAGFDMSTLSELYGRWERQHWTAQGIDLSADRRDWLSLTEQERWQWYWLASFSHFSKSETDALTFFAKLLPHLPRPEQQCLLGAQIADESRHAFFFARFHDEVLSTALPTTRKSPISISPAYQNLFVDSASAVVRKAVDEPNEDNLAAAVLHLFIVLEGAVALASLSVIRRLLIKTELFPGLLAGLTHAHRDEVRHAQLGIALLQDIFGQSPASRIAVTAHLENVLPAISDLLQPQPARTAILEALGLNPLERRQRAFNLLRRHLQAIGINAEPIEQWEKATPRGNNQIDQSYDCAPA